MLTTRFKNQWFVVWYTYWFLWLQFLSVLEALSYQDDLQRLIRWSHRKKLPKVKRYYQRLLSETEDRLLHKTIRHPQLTVLAEWVYCAQVILFPPRRFYPVGAGAKYRLRNRSLI